MEIGDNENLHEFERQERFDEKQLSKLVEA